MPHNLIDPILIEPLKGHYFTLVSHGTEKKELELRAIDVWNLYFEVLNKNAELKSARNLASI